MDITLYLESNMTHYVSKGIQIAFVSLGNSYKEFKTEGEFYHLLIDYSLDCDKKLIESKAKQRMFIIAYTLKTAELSQELKPINYILNYCKVDTNLLNQKIF